MAGNNLLLQSAKYNVPAPGANTNILATSLTPKQGVAAFRVTVVLATGSVFNLRTTDGTTAFTSHFNGGVALAAASVYTFTFGVTSGLTYNFQVETDGVIRLLQVDEVTAGVI